MAISTAVKVASGLTATSVAAGGTALVYKYSTDLYAIEKLASSSESTWTIQSSDSPNPAEFTVTLKTGTITTLAPKYGVESNGSWTCTIKTKASDATNLKTKLKEKFKLGESFPTSITDISTTLESKEKEGFVNSCSRNRNEAPASNKDTVASELKLPADKPETAIEAIFGGTWTNPKETPSNPS